jgi:hypothetical protein
MLVVSAKMIRLEPRCSMSRRGYVAWWNRFLGSLNGYKFLALAYYLDVTDVGVPAVADGSCICLNPCCWWQFNF